MISKQYKQPITEQEARELTEGALLRLKAFARGDFSFADQERVKERERWQELMDLKEKAGDDWDLWILFLSKEERSILFNRWFPSGGRVPPLSFESICQPNTTKKTGNILKITIAEGKLREERAFAKLHAFAEGDFSQADYVYPARMMVEKYPDDAKAFLDTLEKRNFERMVFYHRIYKRKKVRLSTGYLATAPSMSAGTYRFRDALSKLLGMDMSATDELKEQAKQMVITTEKEMAKASFSFIKEREQQQEKRDEHEEREAKEEIPNSVYVVSQRPGTRIAIEKLLHFGVSKDEEALNLDEMRQVALLTPELIDTMQPGSVVVGNIPLEYVARLQERGVRVLIFEVPTLFGKGIKKADIDIKQELDTHARLAEYAVKRYADDTLPQGEMLVHASSAQNRERIFAYLRAHGIPHTPGLFHKSGAMNEQIRASGRAVVGMGLLPHHGAVYDERNPLYILERTSDGKERLVRCEVALKKVVYAHNKQQLHN